VSAGNHVLLMQLSQRVSAKGNLYYSGWLGKASVVGFPGEPNRFGNATVDLFVSEPQPKAGDEKAFASGSPAPAPREGYAGGARQRPPNGADRGAGWCGSRYRKPRVPAPAGALEVLDDTLEGIGR